mgnify:CR=1 FL=1
MRPPKAMRPAEQGSGARIKGGRLFERSEVAHDLTRREWRKVAPSAKAFGSHFFCLHFFGETKKSSARTHLVTPRHLATDNPPWLFVSPGGLAWLG